MGKYSVEKKIIVSIAIICFLFGAGFCTAKYIDRRRTEQLVAEYENRIDEFTKINTEIRERYTEIETANGILREQLDANEKRIAEAKAILERSTESIRDSKDAISRIIRNFNRISELIEKLFEEKQGT